MEKPGDKRGRGTAENRDGINKALIDITERKETEMALAESRKNYSALINSMQEGFALFKIIYNQLSEPKDYLIIDVNPVFEQTVGMSKKIMRGKTVFRKSFAVEKYWLEDFNLVATSGQPCSREGYYQNLNRYFQMFTFRPERDLLACLFVDITERRLAELQLEEEKEWLAVTLRSIGDGVIATNVDKRVIFMNSVAENLLGWKEELAVGQTVWDLFGEMEPMSTDCMSTEEMINLKEVELEQLWDRNITIVREGKARIISNRAAPIRNRNGEVTGMVMVLRDITEKCEAEKQIAYLSFNDKLTGLYNRAYIDRIFSDLDAEDQLPMSLILADVNGLKLTNDVFGHQIGDQLLIEMAGILKACCRGGDLICRWGGDEFMIILPRTPASASKMICQRIFKACKHKSRLPIEVSCALGTATRSDMGMQLSDVFSSAEDQMYRAKVMESKGTYHTIIERIKQKLCERGVENQGHIDRMKELACMMADGLDLPGMERDKLLQLVELHDIGNITVPVEILLKDGPLTLIEWEKVKKHCEVGFRLAHTVPDLKPIADAILSHHERYNGLGYPQGLRGESIPLLARILAVIVSFDVMTHEQVYKQAVPVETAYRELKEVAGTQLDPELVNLFVIQLQGLD